MERYGKMEPNFIECKTVEEANRVDPTLYSFIKFSDTRDCYIFKKRAGK
jgi:hypothetical protein